VPFTLIILSSHAVYECAIVWTIWVHENRELHWLVPEFSLPWSLVHRKLLKPYKRTLATVLILICCVDVPEAFVSSTASNSGSSKCWRFVETQTAREADLLVVYCVRETNWNTNYMYACAMCGIRMIDEFARTMCGIRVIVYGSDKGNNCIKICVQ
jgi:hypothetical protein